MQPTRKRETFTTIRTEGGLLPPDLLERIASGDRSLDGVDPASYHLAPNEKITEAASRSWNRLRGYWETFRAAAEKLPHGDTGTSLTRERWLLPLFTELGYGRLQSAKSIEVDGKSFAVSHAWGKLPIHLVGCFVDLDKRTARVAGASQASPHGLVQELLNRSEDYLWAFVTNGKRLRLLRDNASLTRQAYIEFDLESMFDGDVYSDFVLLWMLCHQSRVEAEKPSDFWLERWSQTAQQEGTRALDSLRKGVEEAIVALGSGFIAHPANRELRAKLQTQGGLNKHVFYRQLLRVVYRLLFLFVAEDRNLLLDPNADVKARERYVRFYATTRLRQLAAKQRGTQHSDLWAGLSLVLSKLHGGCPELALPALGSFLFRNDTTPDLVGCELTNHALLEAIRALCQVRGNVRRPVNYKLLQTEELGSVYEALLELAPEMNVDAGTFTLKTAGGNERKTTGSYYTPDSLVLCLLDSALNPVLDEAVKQPNPEKAILSLTVCDPACGSGHFLIKAAHRMAKRLASVRTGDEEPSPEATGVALRDVIGRCIYGVDINPMAVELCKVALWMEALVPGKPLSFLDHHIQGGNALIGTTPALLEEGIPEAAFAPIGDDDKAFVSEWRKRHRKEYAEREQLSFDDSTTWGEMNAYARRIEKVVAEDDDSLEDIEFRERLYAEALISDEARHVRLWHDAWCAAFVWPKRRDGKIPYPLTERTFKQLLLHPDNTLPETIAEIDHLQQQYGFFHWHLAFPEIFQVNDQRAHTQTSNRTPQGWSGGFDIVLGNPPWERVKLQELEFFATRDSAIAEAQNAAARKKVIAALPLTNPPLWQEWSSASRAAQGESHFARNSGRYPLCGQGDVNTYALFAELNWQILSKRGRAGFIVPSGIATDDTTKDYFQAIMQSGALCSLWEFVNEGFFSGAGKGHMLRFALTTLSGNAVTASKADFMFQGQSVSDLADPERHLTLSAKDIETINPNTATCPIFRTKRDAQLALSLYRRTGVLWQEKTPDGNPWGLRFMTMFHMANDSGLFRTRAELAPAGWKLTGSRFEKDSNVMLPLYEAKMVSMYNHRSGTFEGAAPNERPHRLASPSIDELASPEFSTLPFYWISEREVNERLENVWDRGWLVGWRNITDARASIRTVVSSLIPRSGVNHSLQLMMPAKDARITACLYANLCSFSLDYCARQKLGGINLTYFTMRQLPVLAPSTYNAYAAWDQKKMLRDWLLLRILELTYTSWDLQAFAEDCGDFGPPFVWDSERRFTIQCEIDAAFFHLYELPREDVNYIMDTFPVVRRNDEDNYREYRTKLVIVDIFDKLSHAMAAGQPYISPLSPLQRIY